MTTPAVLAMVKLIDSSPAGMEKEAIAKALKVSLFTIKARLQIARQANLISATSTKGGGGRSRWVTERNRDRAMAEIAVLMEETRIERYKRKSKFALERADALIDVSDMPLNQRIVSAAEAKPLRVKAVRSVFELGAM